LEESTRKSLHLFALQSGVSKAPVHIALKLLKLQPYRIRVIQELFPADWEARSQYCRWFQELVTNKSFGLKLVFFLNEMLFILRGSIN
jgi:hypothetical protein